MLAEDMSPGSPRWYLTRLTERLMSRQTRYRVLENYAVGKHPVPNGDKRYVSALGDLQRKCKTNYIGLVINAVTSRMRVRAFTFDDTGEFDEDAREIWKYNSMDLQSEEIFKIGGTLGDCYVLVSPPDPALDDTGLPIITAEDPTCCITEEDPRYPQRSLAGLKIYQSDVDGHIYGILYLPEAVYTYVAPNPGADRGVDTATLTKVLTSHPSAGGFVLEDVQPNPAGKVTLIRGNWQPAFGTMGRGEAEDVLTIQDRINHTVLDRLIISKNQAYHQRWISGTDVRGSSKDGKGPWKPGSDVVWAHPNENAKFGQFDQADLTQTLQAIRDDVGDLAATSMTPASFLMNRMVNVSGDTLTQDQSALVGKVRLRMQTMGQMFVEAMRVAFLLKGDATKAKATEASTVWEDPEVRALSELADALGKLVAAGIPLEVAMRQLGYSPEDIDLAKKQAEEQKVLDQQALSQQQDHEMTIAKTTSSMKGSGNSKPKPKPKTPSK